MQIRSVFLGLLASTTLVLGLPVLNFVDIKRTESNIRNIIARGPEVPMPQAFHRTASYAMSDAETGVETKYN